MQKNPKRYFSQQHPLLLKTHLLCMGLIFPLLPHCYLSIDVRPPPKLISHATESSSSQAGSLLGDIPLVSRKPASHLPLFYLLPFHFPALFLRKASIQKPLQWREAGCKLFSFIAVCTISYYSHLWTPWCLTLPTFSTQPSPCVTAACATLWRRLSKYCTSSVVNYFFSDFCPYLNTPSDLR